MARKTATEFKPIKGRLPVLQYALPGELSIDPAYQRALDASSDALIGRIAAEWDWALFQPLTVSRRADGQMFVIDGQHRLAAARLRGDIGQLPCVINEYASATAEAASFVALNQQRKPLNAMELFRAAVASGEAEAVTIHAAMRRAGLKLAPHTNYRVWKPGMVANVAGLRNAWRRYGEEATLIAMKLLAQAWPTEALQFGGTVWQGIAPLVAANRAKLDDPQTFAAMLAMIQSRSQQDWWRAIRQCALDTGLTGEAGAGHVMGNAWREATGQRALTATFPKPQGEMPPDRFDLVHKEGHRWCAQCEKTVSPEKAAGCTSKFCKAKDAPQRVMVGRRG